MSDSNTNLTEVSTQVLDGNPQIVYDLPLHVQGACELMAYEGGVPNVHFLTGGTPKDYPNTIAKLEVSDPAQTYYLNRSGSVPTNFSTMLDYVATIRARGGATLTLSLIRGDHNLYPKDQGGGTVYTNLTNYNGEYIQVKLEAAVQTAIKEIRSTPSSCRNWLFSGYETNTLGNKAEK